VLRRVDVAVTDVWAGFGAARTKSRQNVPAAARFVGTFSGPSTSPDQMGRCVYESSGLLAEDAAAHTLQSQQPLTRNDQTSANPRSPRHRRDLRPWYNPDGRPTLKVSSGGVAAPRRPAPAAP
jgi:hypothetical protein